MVRFKISVGLPDLFTYEYQIAKDNANGNKFYMVKDVTKIDSSPTGWNQHPGSGKSPNDIMTSSQSNFNLSNVTTQANLGQNLNQNNTIKPPKSDLEWLEEVKRKRKNLGWW